MNQVANTVMIPVEEYEALKQQRDSYKDVAEAHSSAFQECIRLREELSEIKQQRDELLAAAENLIRVKGRHHTEQAYKQLEAAIAKVKEQKCLRPITSWSVKC